MGLTPRWRSRTADIRPIVTTERRRWEIGVACVFTLTLQEIGPVPVEWTKCALCFHHKGKPYGTEVGACAAGATDFKGRTLQFTELLSLDTSAGVLNAKVMEIELKCWSPVGLDVVQKTVASTQLNLSSFVEARNHVKGLILPMNVMQGMELKQRPILQIDFVPTVADEHLRVMERYGNNLLTRSSSVPTPLTTRYDDHHSQKPEPEAAAPVLQPRKPSVATPLPDLVNETIDEGRHTPAQGHDTQLAEATNLGSKFDHHSIQVDGTGIKTRSTGGSTGDVDEQESPCAYGQENGRNVGGLLRFCGGGWVKGGQKLRKQFHTCVETKRSAPPAPSNDGLPRICMKASTGVSPVASPLKCTEVERGVLFDTLISRHQKCAGYLSELLRRERRSSRKNNMGPVMRCAQPGFLTPSISTDGTALTVAVCDESWTQNPEYSSRKRQATKISAMDAPVRTVERHLAEVGKRALHKGLFSCSDDIVQTVPGVRVTGEQGQIWSCNPMYREDHFCVMYAPTFPPSSSSASSPTSSSSSSGDSLSIGVGKEYSGLESRPQSPMKSWSHDEDAQSLEDDETDSDLDIDEENEINKLGDDFHPLGLTYQVHLEEVADEQKGNCGPTNDDEKLPDNENKSYEVSTIDTPRAIFQTASEAGNRSAFSEFGVQTEDSWTREDDSDESESRLKMFQRDHSDLNGSFGRDEGLNAFEGSEFLCASARELSDLRGIQDQIEDKDQEILELFQGLSNEFAGCTPGALEEVRILREMVEQKELETSQLYSQISQEMQCAMQPAFQHALSETVLCNSCGVDFGVNKHEAGGAVIKDDFWDCEGVSTGNQCPSARNPPPQSMSCTAPRPISRAEVPNPSPPRLTKFMSGSSYYEAELDNAVSVTYGELNKRVQELEEDLRKKESEIAERDQVIQQLKLRKQGVARVDSARQFKTDAKYKSMDDSATPAFGCAPKDSYCFSPRFEFSLQDVDNTCDLWGQGNPPWDSSREDDVQRHNRKKLWSDVAHPGYKMFDKVEKFEVGFPPIVPKKGPALM